MRLVICDDNRILGEALAFAMEEGGHQVVAVTTTTAGGLAAVASLRPDIIMLDLHFAGGLEGLDAARELRRHHQGTAVLVLSGSSDRATWSAVMKIGVAGCLRKDQNVAQIARALDVIAAGGVVLDPAVSGKASPAASRRRHACPPQVLSPREQEVLRRLVAGQSTGQMAGEMHITISTLRTYVKNVLTKIGAHSRLQAAALAAREELLSEASA